MLGREASWAPRVKNTTAYDNAGRTTSITATNTSAGILTRRAYTYTLNGTKDGAQRKTMTTNTGAATTYGYDKLNRLTSAVIGSTTETWSYDQNGNRTLETETGAPNVHSAFNAADQLCWTGPPPGRAPHPRQGPPATPTTPTATPPPPGPPPGPTTSLTSSPPTPAPA